MWLTYSIWWSFQSLIHKSLALKSSNNLLLTCLSPLSIKFAHSHYSCMSNSAVYLTNRIWLNFDAKTICHSRVKTSLKFILSFLRPVWQFRFSLQQTLLTALIPYHSALQTAHMRHYLRYPAQWYYSLLHSWQCSATLLHSWQWYCSLLHSCQRLYPHVMGVLYGIEIAHSVPTPSR